jgi:tRNA and rRNA cytosine-C5-methylases
MLDKEGIQLREILYRAVGPERADIAYDAILSKPSVSVRVNPSKVASPEEFAKSHFREYSGRVDWCPSGFVLSERPIFTLDPLFHCGCYYVQDSSAMAVGHVLRNMFGRFHGPREACQGA